MERKESMPRGVGAALGVVPSVGDDDSSRTMRISLQLEARKLPNMDVRSKSDPFAIVYRKVDDPASVNDEWIKIGQTETVYNNLNPKWSTTFTIEYRFGTTTVLRFSIYDRDSKDEDLSKQDYIGEVRCTIAQIVLADYQRLEYQIHNKNAQPGAQTGTLTIRGEEQKGDLGESVTFQFAVLGLRRGRKPFYVLSSKNKSDDDFSPVIYSEVHQTYAGSHQITSFKPITKSLARLVNGDLDRELKVEFMEYDRRGSHYRGGSVNFTLRAARAAVASSSSAKFTLRKRKSNRQVVDAGTLIIKTCDISIPFSFIDYVRSGVVINTVIAVDLSKSNGIPSDPQSLHYNNRSTPNEYVIALREVGSVLSAYDTSKTFPVFGFGAALPTLYNETAHCFALTGDITKPICRGIEGVIDMYYIALGQVYPSEPCRYGPVLEHVIRTTREQNDHQGQIVYTVLLLVTDGEFSDFADVANLICAAAELPLSIVIVGVGNSRFLQLERLDGDEKPLCSTEGIPCARDIVQFVQFHKHRYNTAQLAREVLDEIPEQLVSYMRSKSIKPEDIVPDTGAPSTSSVIPDQRLKGRSPQAGPGVQSSASPNGTHHVGYASSDVNQSSGLHAGFTSPAVSHPMHPRIGSQAGQHSQSIPHSDLHQRLSQGTFQHQTVTQPAEMHHHGAAQTGMHHHSATQPSMLHHGSAPAPGHHQGMLHARMPHHSGSQAEFHRHGIHHPDTHPQGVPQQRVPPPGPPLQRVPPPGPPLQRVPAPGPPLPRVPPPGPPQQRLPPPGPHPSGMPPSTSVPYSYHPRPPPPAPAPYPGVSGPQAPYHGAYSQPHAPELASSFAPQTNAYPAMYNQPQQSDFSGTFDPSHPQSQGANYPYSLQPPRPPYNMPSYQQQ